MCFSSSLMPWSLWLQALCKGQRGENEQQMQSPTTARRTRSSRATCSTASNCVTSEIKLSSSLFRGFCLTSSLSWFWILSLVRDNPVRANQAHVSIKSHAMQTSENERALDILLLPFLRAIVRAASASNQTALVNDRAFKRHRCSKVKHTGLGDRWRTACVPLTSWPFS
jgi:hypothetical protein